MTRTRSMRCGRGSGNCRQCGGGIAMQDRRTEAGVALRRRCGTYVVLVSALACASPEIEQRAVREIALKVPITLIAESSALLAGPRGLAIDSVGNVLIVDQRQRQVIRVSPTGAISTIGRAGSGPGEFNVP